MQIRILSMTSCRGGEEVLLRIELREDAYSHGRFFGSEGRPRSEVRELSLLIDHDLFLALAVDTLNTGSREVTSALGADRELLFVDRMNSFHLLVDVLSVFDVVDKEDCGIAKGGDRKSKAEKIGRLFRVLENDPDKSVSVHSLTVDLFDGVEGSSRDKDIPVRIVDHNLLARNGKQIVSVFAVKSKLARDYEFYRVIGGRERLQLFGKRGR